MLLKRRNAEPWKQKMRNLLWPSMGFRRMFDYYKHRSIRIKASEHEIAAGIAFGCLVSWTPLFGTHLIQCFIFCWLTRTSFIASVIGSAWGNMLTTPLLMLISYHTGKIMLSVLGYDDPLPHLTDGIEEHEVGAPGIFLATLIGGYTVGILTFPLFYYPTYYAVKGARAARRLRIAQKAHKEAVSITGQDAE